MEIIFADQGVESWAIEQVLNRLFPELNAFETDYVGDPPTEFDSSNPNHIIFYRGYDPEKIEFGYYVEITRSGDENSQERAISIAHALLAVVNTRFLIDYVNPKQPESPYFSLIFEKEGIFLADDFDTDVFDGSKDLVRKLEKIDLPTYKFDSFGKIIV